ncbi:SDR family oxidoreductase [Deinococcus sp.]|uniref:SDR family oxidoreductase n=1 Tax=Deinococcus sp. TaxID=47478 RepID=UPI002869BA2B|nr:SDR family oxidoreductase [Deinococcus sp.]
MSGNTILITGGASGIGLGLAQAFHALGNTVLIAGRRQDALDAAVAAHPGLHAYTLDVTDPASIAALTARVTAEHPALNVLINNAGIMQAEDIQAAPDTSVAEATVVTNLLGPIRVTHALLPTLLAQPHAAVMNVSSGLASVPLAATPTYSATKAAVHSYTESLRWQLRDTAVQVLELTPPAVGTDLMPGSRANPHAMPLDAYVTEVMDILTTQPDAREICVQAVRFLRDAEATGTYDRVFDTVNAARR